MKLVKHTIRTLYLTLRQFLILDKGLHTFRNVGEFLFIEIIVLGERLVMVSTVEP